MFDILIYLFDNYVHNEVDVVLDYNSLTNDLLDIGFQKRDIYNALLWLKKLSSYKHNTIISIKKYSNQLSTRIYTQEELCKLNTDCRGFILFLEQLEVLTLDTREIIIERIMDLDIIELHIEDFKWIILMILFNIPGCEKLYQKLENFLFNCHEKILY